MALLLAILLLSVGSVQIATAEDEVPTNVTEVTPNDNTLETTTMFPPPPPYPVYIPPESTSEGSRSSTGSSRKGRLVGGTWNPKELAVQFTGSPVFPGGYPISSMQQTSSTDFISSSGFNPMSIPLSAQPEPPTPSTSSPSPNISDPLEDRILSNFGPPPFSYNNNFDSNSGDKGANQGPQPIPDFHKLYYNIPEPQAQQQQQQQQQQFVQPAPAPAPAPAPEAGPPDANQMAMAQAAIQAAQSLFQQLQSQQSAPQPSSSPLSPPQLTQLLSNALPLISTLTNSQGQGNSAEAPMPFYLGPDNQMASGISFSPSVPPPPIVQEMAASDNKRYGGGESYHQEYPIHQYHEMQHTYYQPQPSYPPPSYGHDSYHHQPHHYNNHKPNPIHSAVNAFKEIKHHVIGSAQRFGEKVAHIASPENLHILLPAATTLIVGGLALKYLTSQSAFSNSSNFPLFSFGPFGGGGANFLSARSREGDQPTIEAMQFLEKLLTDNSTETKNASSAGLKPALRANKAIKYDENNNKTSHSIHKRANEPVPHQVLILEKVNFDPKAQNSSSSPLSASLDTSQTAAVNTSSSNNTHSIRKREVNRIHKVLVLEKPDDEDGANQSSAAASNSTDLLNVTGNNNLNSSDSQHTVQKRSATISHKAAVLVFEKDAIASAVNSNPIPRAQRRRRAAVHSKLVFVKPAEDNKDNSAASVPVSRQKRFADPMDPNMPSMPIQHSNDGTFTEEELNSLVSRLDPVQRQFLQKLQWYGFDRWKEMPCAKYILCDVMVHSDLQHIFDLQRRIGIFLSLMDDDSARKVEVMIKDLILSIEARDCSQFYCSSEPHLFGPPPPPPPPPPPVAPVNPPFPLSNSNQLFHHPFSFPRSDDATSEADV